jgi:hypothetical protein
MDGDGDGGRTPSLGVMWGSLYLPLPLCCLRHMGVNLYRGSFTKVARFDVEKAVDADTGADMGGFCLYGCFLNLLEVSTTSLLTWEYWKLIILH